MNSSNKKSHFIAGSLIGLSTLFIGNVGAFTLVLFAAALKELYDVLFSDPITEMSQDVLWTVIGGSLVITIISIFGVL